MTTVRSLRYGRSVLVGVMRRRVAVFVMLALPLALYAVSHDAVGRSVRSLLFGLSWSLSTVAFFATAASRDLEPRLALLGHRRHLLVSARLLALTGLGLLLALVLWAVVALDQPLPSASRVALAFATTAIVAITFGTAAAALVRSELPGVLVLFSFAGLQAVANPFEAWTRVLPFWSSRELGTWAIDGPAQGSLAGGLAHAAIAGGCCIVVLVLAELRTGPHRRWSTRTRSTALPAP